MSKTVLNNVTLTNIVDWLNEEFGSKDTGKKFTTSDVQGYIFREKIPETYGGGFSIKKKQSKFNNSLYVVKKI